MCCGEACAISQSRVRTLKNKQWLNGNCEEAKRNKEKAWKKFKKNSEALSREGYKTARNRYVEVGRTAQKEYEQRVVENCDSDPKMFYKFINGKVNKREAIEKVKVGEVYENARDITCAKCLQRRSISLEKGLRK